MSKLVQLRERLQPGVRLECVENTLTGRPRAPLTVTELDTDRVRGVTPTGAVQEIILPKRGLIDWHDEELVQWRLDTSGPLAKHHVRYRIEQPVS